jgi:ankyrin repeat protein
MRTLAHRAALACLAMALATGIGGTAAASSRAANQQLQAALSRQDADAIDAAIAAGADINLKSEGGGQTPLMAAVLGGKTENVRALLKHNPDATIGEMDGYTPMHGAGFQGRAEIVPLLAAHGLDPLERHSDGYIGMHRACWGTEPRHTATVKAFLEAGAMRTICGHTWPMLMRVAL